MSDNALQFNLYQRADSLEAAWLESLTRFLWEKGMRFDAGPEPSATSWAEELQRHIGDYSTYSLTNQSRKDFQGPLSALLQQMQHGGGGFEMYDRGLLYTLRFDDTFAPGESVVRSDPTRLRRITLSTVVSGHRAWSHRYSPSITHVMTDINCPLLLSYQQVMVSFCYWAEQLCTFIAPLYGFGYNPGRDLSEELEAQEDEQAVIPQMLLNNLLPDLHAILKLDGWLVYAATTLLSPEQIMAWLATPQTTLQHLSSGGYLRYTPPTPYRYEQGIGFDYFYRGKAAQEQGAMTQAIAYYERALAIFMVNGDTDPKNLAIFYLYHLRELLSRRQGQS